MLILASLNPFGELATFSSSVKSSITTSFERKVKMAGFVVIGKIGDLTAQPDILQGRLAFQKQAHVFVDLSHAPNSGRLRCFRWHGQASFHMS